MALPPGPAQPAIVQLARWILHPLPFLRESRARFGDTFTLRMAGIGTLVMVSAPEAIKQVFTADPAALPAGEALADFRVLLGGSSVLLLDGAAHLRQRRLLMPPFHGERMHAYARIMRDIADDAVDAWPLDRPFALHPSMQEVTLAVILRAVFGLDADARMRELAALLTQELDTGQSPFVLLPFFQRDAIPGTRWRRFRKLQEQVDAALFAEIARRRAAREATTSNAVARDDVLSLLLEAKDEAGAGMTDQELRDELMTLLVAGHETSASTLAWAFAALLQHPEVADRARSELADVVGEGPLEPAHLPRLEYLDAVLKETLRMHPIIPLAMRRVKRPIEIDGYALPPGVNVSPNIYLAHHRAETYPDPDRFDPARWIGAKTDPYAWLPFGGGVRRCIGMAFAQYEMKIVLAAALLRARLALTSRAPIATVRRGITLVPAGGTRVVLRSRAPRARPSPSLQSDP